MMVDVRAKGRRGEIKVRDRLRKYDQEDWQRVPLSGALEFLKGDLYVPNRQMYYAVEVKTYADCPIDHLVISGKPKLFSWWQQAIDNCTSDQKPCLIFQWNRSKIYVMIEGMPINVERFLFLNREEASILELEEWLTCDKPEFVK